ncbi:hypothetical protein CSKR_102072 [Clonorchis sinensis]|uniref:Uncharacterized protein n=1 Tax=Clonorchis sinensis TaxID=79923 RepID=A0A419PMB6_CLOSI|nr:hypothetical protein CSKR_102072 [Clonorchis sinensis]
MTPSRHPSDSEGLHLTGTRFGIKVNIFNGRTSTNFSRTIPETKKIVFKRYFPPVHYRQVSRVHCRLTDHLCLPGWDTFAPWINIWPKIPLLGKALRPQLKSYFDFDHILSAEYRTLFDTASYSKQKAVHADPMIEISNVNHDIIAAAKFRSESGLVSNVSSIQPASLEVVLTIFNINSQREQLLFTIFVFVLLQFSSRLSL